MCRNAFILTVCLLAACGTKPPDNNNNGNQTGPTGDTGNQTPEDTSPNSETITLTPAGATVSLPGAQITFPAGAVSSNQEVTMTVLSAPRLAVESGRTVASTYVLLAPHGLSFAQPVTIALDVTQSSAGTLHHIRLADDTAAAWSDEGEPTVTGNIATFTITQFCTRCLAYFSAECVPNCNGRVCGADPHCGQPCGSCSGGLNCSQAGTCVAPNCVSDCTGNECGLDPVCGQPCGSCSVTETCNASNLCENLACTGSCTNRVCGSDGCGESCGDCQTNEVCAAGACVPSWTESPCDTQPEGSVAPMVGGCSERGNRSAFTVGPSGVTGLTGLWTWTPPTGSFSPANNRFPYLSSAVVSDLGIVYVTRWDGLWAVLDGETLWQIRVEPDFDHFNDSPLVGPPVLVGDKVVVVARSGIMYAFNALTARPEWTRVISQDALSGQYQLLPVALDDRIIVHGKGQMFVIDAEDGSVIANQEYGEDESNMDLSLRGNTLVGGSVNGVPYIFGYDYADFLTGGTGATWTVYAQISRAIPLTFVPSPTSGDVEQGDIVYYASESLFGDRFLFFADPASGDRRPVRYVGLPYFARMAINKENIALVADGTLAAEGTLAANGGAIHTFVDLGTATGPTGSTGPSFATPVGATAPPLALSDGRFVLVDRDGLVVVTAPGASQMTHRLTGFSASLGYPNEHGLAVATPAMGADGTLFITIGSDGGKLYALKIPD